MNHLAAGPGPAAVGEIARPLAVDLDGTLLRTDVLAESALALAVAAPWRALRALAALRHGRAALKRRIAGLTPLEVADLPLNPVLLAWLREQKAAGRRILLVTAAEASQAQVIAERVGLFDTVLASDGRTNLRGEHKARRLCALFGEGGFDYAGDAAPDHAVWEHAAQVIVVNADAATIRAARARYREPLILAARPPRGPALLQALRPHQWLKNLLVFLPALTSQHIGVAALLQSLAAFAGFSLCASTAYLINDFVDLGHDRLHPTKHARPFASGEVRLVDGLAAIPALLAVAALVALALPAAFAEVLAGYFLLTLAYSAVLKRRLVIDVITLACLYGVRLIAGAAAIGVPVSHWLLTFAVFLFFGLALVKRCAELSRRIELRLGDPPGRAYRVADLPVLTMLAAASACAATLVFCLYINGDTVVPLYRHPERLWVIPLVLMYWLGRVMLLAHRGQMHEDPVLFAATDRTSLLCGAVIALAVAASVR